MDVFSFVGIWSLNNVLEQMKKSEMKVIHPEEGMNNFTKLNLLYSKYSMSREEKSQEHQPL